jgi:hypothetical protein
MFTRQIPRVRLPACSPIVNVRKEIMTVSRFPMSIACSVVSRWISNVIGFLKFCSRFRLAKMQQIHGERLPEPAAEFWTGETFCTRASKRGSFRSGSNMGSSLRSAGVSGRSEAKAPA